MDGQVSKYSAYLSRAPSSRDERLSTGKEQMMNCPKCGGYMTLDRLMDFYAKERQWRCINCGCTSPTVAAMLKLNNRATPRLS